LALNSQAVFQSVGKTRLSERVADQIRQALREGRFLNGERLPAERVLAAKFGVSRPVLSEALRVLELQGFVSVRHGQGAFVKDPTTDILNAPLEEWLPANSDFVREFYEARLVVEPECAALATLKTSPEDIADLRELVKRSHDAIASGNIPAFVGFDIDFHTTIAEIGGNSLLLKMLKSAINPETDPRKIVLRLPGRPPLACAGHDRIVDTIETGDPEDAREAMIDALQTALQHVDLFLANRGFSE